MQANGTAFQARSARSFRNRAVPAQHRHRFVLPPPGIAAFSWQARRNRCYISSGADESRHNFQWEPFAMAQAVSPFSVEERIVDGDTVWVAIRARGAEWSWLTPAEAAQLGRQWVERYGRSEPRMIAAE